jgi:hypothetical protein
VELLGSGRNADAFAAGDGARLLADLHDRLHALPALLSRDPDARVLHLDLHPGNVLLAAAALVADRPRR